MVVDGAEGRTFDELSPPQFSGDGQHIAYSGERQKRLFFVVDGQESAPYDREDLIAPAFSSDGKHVAYTATRDQKHVLVVDGVESAIPHPAGPLRLFSPDGRKFAYVAKLAGREKLVVGGEISHEYDSILSVQFSPDGRRTACVCILRGKMLVLHDGIESREYDSIDPDSLTYSRDSRHLAFIARQREKSYLVANESESGPFDRLLVPKQIVFDGPDALHAIATRGGDVLRLEVEIAR
jgi:hypothetical protein